MISDHTLTTASYYLIALGCLLTGFLARHYWLKLKAPAFLPYQKTVISRAHARIMFFNGLISIEELNQFYDTHPEAENGNSGTGN